MKKYLLGFFTGCLLALLVFGAIFFFYPVNYGIPSAHSKVLVPVFIRVTSTEKGYVYSCNSTEADLPSIQKRVQAMLDIDPDQYFIISYPTEMSRYEILKIPRQLHIPTQNSGFIHEQTIEVPGGMLEGSRTSASSQ